MALVETRFVAAGVPETVDGIDQVTTATERLSKASGNTSTATGKMATEHAQALQSMAGHTKKAYMGMSELEMGIMSVTMRIMNLTMAAGLISAPFALAAGASIGYLAQIETSSLGIAAAYMTGGQYIDTTTGKALEGQQALKAAQGDTVQVMEQLKVANLQTIATLDQLVRVYQETLPVAMAKGFNRDQVMQFTQAMVQAAGAIGLPMDQMGEETRSLLTGAINPRNSRIATVLGLRNEDIAEYEGNATALFGFLMSKLEAYRVAGIESQQTWAGLTSNFKDIAGQAGGMAFVGLFEAAKYELTEITSKIITIDEKTKTIKWNPEFLSFIDDIKLGIDSVTAEVYRLSMLLDKIGGTATTVGAFLMQSQNISTFGLFSKKYDEMTDKLIKWNRTLEENYNQSDKALQAMANREVGLDAAGNRPDKAMPNTYKQRDALKDSADARALAEKQAAYDKQVLEAEIAVKRQYAANVKAFEDASLKDSLAQVQSAYDQKLLSTQAYIDKKYALEKTAYQVELNAAQEYQDQAQRALNSINANPNTDRLMQLQAEQKLLAAKKEVGLDILKLSSLENSTLIERNKLLGEEAQWNKTKSLLQDQYSIIQQQIDLATKQGLTEEAFDQQKTLDMMKLKTDYQQKMIDFQKQLNGATEDQIAIIQRSIDLYNNLTTASISAVDARSYVAPAASGAAPANTGWGWDANGNIIGSSSGTMGNTTSSFTRNVPGVDNSAAISKAKSDAAAATNTALALAESIQKTTYAMNQDLAVRALSLVGTVDETALLKLQISQQNELAKAQTDGVGTSGLLIVQQMEMNKLLHDQQLAKAIKDTQTFFDTIKTSISGLVSAGNTLVTSLRTAATSLRQASGDLSTGNQSTLSPAQQYELSRQNLSSTVNQAMTTGDAASYAKIPSLVTAFLDQSKGMNASGSQYKSDFSWSKNLLDTAATASDLAASQADKVITAAENQQKTLDAIKNALTTDNTAALPKLYAELSSASGTLNKAVQAATTSLSDSGTIAGKLGTVNTALGSTGVMGWLSTVSTGLTGTGGIVGAVGGVTSGLSPLTGIATNTGNTAGNLTNGTTTAAWLSSIDSKTKTIKQITNHAGDQTVYNIGHGEFPNSYVTYDYYANGGIANKASIFGEAGIEAAVPLPDGRTIPVTLSRSDNYKLDLSEVVTELKAIRAENAALRSELKAFRRQQSQEHAEDVDTLERSSGKVAIAVGGNGAAMVRY